MQRTPFFGKYRGKVTNNIDPEQQGRIQISVPSVLGKGQLSWAMPCVPYAGKNIGWLAIPAIDADVWIEFERGDINAPIWSGCFWGEKGTAPSSTPAIKIFKTDSMSLQFNDGSKGGVTLEVTSPAVANTMTLKYSSDGIELKNMNATLLLNSKGIQIKYGEHSVNLSDTSVNVNNGALEIS